MPTPGKATLPPLFSSIEADPRWEPLTAEERDGVRRKWLDAVQAAGRAGLLSDWSPEEHAALARDIGYLPTGERRVAMPSAGQLGTAYGDVARGVADVGGRVAGGVADAARGGGNLANRGAAMVAAPLDMAADAVRRGARATGEVASDVGRGLAAGTRGAVSSGRANEDMLRALADPNATEADLRQIAQGQKEFFEGTAPRGVPAFPVNLAQSAVGMGRAGLKAVPALAAGTLVAGPAGAAAGWKIGSGIAFAQQGAGEIARDLLAKGYSVDTVRTVAPLYGIAYGAAEMMFDVLGAGFGGGKVAGEVVKPALRRTLLNYVRNVGTETAEEGIQKFAELAFTEIAAGIEARTGKKFETQRGKALFTESLKAMQQALPVAATLVGGSMTLNSLVNAGAQQRAPAEPETPPPAVPAAVEPTPGPAEAPEAPEPPQTQAEPPAAPMRPETPVPDRGGRVPGAVRPARGARTEAPSPPVPAGPVPAAASEELNIPDAVPPPSVSEELNLPEEVPPPSVSETLDLPAPAEAIEFPPAESASSTPKTSPVGPFTVEASSRANGRSVDETFETLEEALEFARSIDESKVDFIEIFDGDGNEVSEELDAPFPSAPAPAQAPTPKPKKMDGTTRQQKPSPTPIPAASTQIMADAIAARDVDKLTTQGMLDPRNRQWRKQFEDATGVKLPKTKKAMFAAVQEWANAPTPAPAAPTSPPAPAPTPKVAQAAPAATPKPAQAETVAPTPVVTTEPDGDKTVVVPMPTRKADNLTPKEQKAYLLAEVEVAISQAPSVVDLEGGLAEVYAVIESLPKLDAMKRRSAMQWLASQKALGVGKKGSETLPQYTRRIAGALFRNIAAAASDKVTVEVPGDGTFTVPNVKESLLAFRDRAEKQFGKRFSSIPNFNMPPLQKKTAGTPVPSMPAQAAPPQVEPTAPVQATATTEQEPAPATQAPEWKRSTPAPGTPERAAIDAEWEAADTADTVAQEAARKAEDAAEKKGYGTKAREVATRRAEKLREAAEAKRTEMRAVRERMRRVWADDDIDTGDPIKAAKARERIGDLTWTQAQTVIDEELARRGKAMGATDEEIAAMKQESRSYTGMGQDKPEELLLATVRSVKLKAAAEEKIEGMPLSEQARDHWLARVRGASIWPEDIARTIELAEKASKEYAAQQEAEEAKKKEGEARWLERNRDTADMLAGMTEDERERWRLEEGDTLYSVTAGPPRRVVYSARADAQRDVDRMSPMSKANSEVVKVPRSRNRWKIVPSREGLQKWMQKFGTPAPPPRPDANIAAAAQARVDPLTSGPEWDIAARELAKARPDLYQTRADMEGMTVKELRAAAVKSKLDEAYKNLVKDVPDVPADDTDATMAKLDAIADAALKRMDARRKKARAVDPVGLLVVSGQDLSDAVIYGSVQIAKGAVKFKRWSQVMLRDLGEDIRPHLDAIWEKSKELAQHKFSKRVAKHPDTPPPVAKAVENRMHEVKHNRETIEKVVGLITEKGLDGAAADFYGDVGLEAGERVPLGQQLADAYMDVNEFPKAIALIEKLDEIGLETGRDVQSFSLWRRALSSPAGAVAAAKHDMAKAEKAVLDPKKPMLDAVKRGLDAAGPGATEAQRREAVNRELRRDRVKVSKLDRSAVDKIIKTASEGKLSDADIRAAFAEKYGLRRLGDDDVAKLKDLSEKIKNAPEGSPKVDATADMLDFIHELRGGDTWSDPLWDLWYANILSGYQTHQRNLISTFANVHADLALMGIRHPTEAPSLLHGYIVGLGRGMEEALLHMATGKTVIRGAHKFGEVTGGKARPYLERKRYRGLKRPLNQWKYVRRALQAEDILLFKPAEYARMYQLTHRMAVDEGLSGRAARKRVAEALGKTPQQTEAMLAQARREGFKGWIREHRRMGELRELQTDTDIIEASADFAERATFNYRPEGQLGMLAMAIGTLTKQYKIPGKFIVPFTDIVANVTNATIDYTLYGLKTAETGRIATRTGPRLLDTDEISLRRMKAWGGTLAMGGMYAAAKAGLLGLSALGPRDREKRNQLRGTGWKPYSIKIGDRYVSYIYTPMAIPLTIVGHLLDAEKYGKLDPKDIPIALAFSCLVAGRAIVNMGFVSGAASVFDILSETNTDEGAIKKALGMGTRLAGSVFPSLIRQIDRAFDPTLPETKRWDIKAQVMAEVPFLQRTLPRRFNRLGETIEVDRSVLTWKGKSRPIWTELAKRGLYIPGIDDGIKVNDGLLMESDPQWGRYALRNATETKAILSRNMPRIARLQKAEAQDEIRRIAAEAMRRAKADLGDRDARKERPKYDPRTNMPVSKAARKPARFGSFKTFGSWPD